MKPNLNLIIAALATLLVACTNTPSEKDKPSGNHAVSTANGAKPVADQSTRTPQTSTKLTQDTSKDRYAWNPAYDFNHNLQNRIPCPDGFQRPDAPKGSFTAWLRRLPLKPGRPKVRLHNGQLKGNQNAHYAIVDIDVGKRDLQQCADAVMRLRAEYLYAYNRESDIHFNFTSGDKADWKRYKEGYRCQIRGNKVTWSKKANQDGSHKNFRRYMDLIFNYAGTASLEKEMQAVSMASIQPGDVLIQGGFPGHAVLVLDVAEHAQTGEKRYLLGQSYMPAQEIHVLKNPYGSAKSPWYSVAKSGKIYTPEWTFTTKDLKRFDNP